MKARWFVFGMWSFLLSGSLLSSCNEEPLYKTEVNQVFNVKSSTDGFVAGDLIYQDSIIYQNQNLPRIKYVFDKNRKISGNEIYPLVKNEKSIKSNYLSSEGNPLSYYEYELDDEHLKVKSEAFDASNDELLRYEEMEYDKKGRLSTRKIFTSNGQLATSYSFIYDAFDNEVRKITQHLLRDTIITEESRITKYYDDKMWKEKWGFINDKPIAYYKRTVKVH